MTPLESSYIPRRQSHRTSSPSEGRKCLSAVLNLNQLPRLPFPCEPSTKRIPSRTRILPKDDNDNIFRSRFTSDTHSGGECKDESIAPLEYINVLNEQENCSTHVIQLPWSDSRGKSAEYTGRVNELMQPHGLGYIVYKDGTVLTCHWSNGTPVNPSCAQPIIKSLQMKPQPTSSPSQRPRTLKLGDVATTQDMHIEVDPQIAHNNAASLALHSFAFVLRSSGEWAYAIVSDRPVESGPDASIRFVMDSNGYTKIIKAKHWSKYIRLVKVVSQDVKIIKRRRKSSVSDNGQGVIAKNDVKKNRSSSESELAKMASFQRAVRRVSLDMSTKLVQRGDD